jgi:hypothetical protein
MPAAVGQQIIDPRLEAVPEPMSDKGLELGSAAICCASLRTTPAASKCLPAVDDGTRHTAV